MYKRLILFIIVAISCSSCEEDGVRPATDEYCTMWGPELPPRSEDRVTIDQGIWGDVWFWEGDFMPLCPSGKVYPVSREVYIYEATRWDEVEWVYVESELNINGIFYRNIPTELISTAQSDSLGFFEIELPAGLYSIFVKKDTLFYANRFDCAGYIFPVEVIEESVTGIEFDVDYAAYW